jgi:hypothetical protein
VRLWQPSGKSRNAGFTAADPAHASDRHAGGEYQLLHEYLRDRFANRLVLTFAEIEDLLGFRLPDAARLQQEWWDGAGPNVPRSPQVEAWTLASRTATVNLSAQCVVFER